MGALFLLPAIIAAWVLGALGVTPIGAESSDEFAETTMRWMMFMAVGIMFLVSGTMHTAFAKSTAESIGWKTNGFQYEIGFVSWGLGIAGIVAATMGNDAWIVVSIVTSVFLVLAGVYHVVEMVREKNFNPGNSMILFYDFGLPISLWILLLMVYAV